jgi:hypothetical protein
VSAITGDAPVRAGAVTGSSRGEAMAITGTAYQVPVEAAGPPAEPIAAIDAGFSVRSPQRTAQLRAAAKAAKAAEPGERITGAFALGRDKITGNLEFLFRPRPASAPDDPAGRRRITGEGRPGRGITGDAWGDQSNVTGVEGHFAAGRNPSARAGRPNGFAGAGAGARAFKPDAPREEPKQLVTGMFGFSSKASARVTLSGGAQV